jgi:hypothetical protein
MEGCTIALGFMRAGVRKLGRTFSSGYFSAVTVFVSASLGRQTRSSATVNCHRILPTYADNLENENKRKGTRVGVASVGIWEAAARACIVQR